jgi:hypothetical protein
MSNSKNSDSDAKVCAVIKSPPLKLASSDYVGKTIADLRSSLKEDLEIADGAPATVSKDRGQTYKAPVGGEKYVIENQDVVEFGRGSSTKGFFSIRFLSVR